jgi:hypothetical protein
VKQVLFAESSAQLVGRIDDFSTPVLTVAENVHDRQLWNFLVEKYHYKGCRIIVGRHLKYLIYLNHQLIGCLAFADAVLQLSARDQWINWNARQRQAGLARIINNVRFLILPWVKIRNLASKLLALSARIVHKIGKPISAVVRCSWRVLLIKNVSPVQAIKRPTGFILGRPAAKAEAGKNIIIMARLKTFMSILRYRLILSAECLKIKERSHDKVATQLFRC